MNTPDPRRPESYPRRVLLAVTGLSPQVVTETVFALSCSRETPFVPTEIHLLTTAEGSERARLALLSEDPGWFHRMRRDYGLPPIRLDADTIHVLEDESGNPLSDIRTREDNDRAADLIVEHVRTLTLDPESSVHVSIAGGRKTMGFYLGYALSLYGRPQDRLSHVLVSEPFESSWDFFYPTPYERVIETRDHKLANTAEATVTLAEIPFVRLRQDLPSRLLEGRARYTEAVGAANRGLAAPRLILDLPAKEARADDEPLDLGPTDLAVLLWLAERVRRDDPEVDWAEAGAVDEFLAVARRVLKSASGDYERLSDALGWRGDSRKDMGAYFEPQKSRINGALKRALGSASAERYAIRRTGSRGASRYSLPLTPESIEIRN